MACGVCLASDALVAQPVALNGHAVSVGPRRRAGVVAASLLRPDVSLAPYGAPWEAWHLGGSHAVLLYGIPGAGKSTVAASLAVSAARRSPVLFVAAEEGHSSALRERLARVGLDDLSAKRLEVSDARDVTELATDLAAFAGGGLVFLDSVDELRVSPAMLLEVLAGRSWVAVCHANARGGAYGGHEWSHAVDAVVRVVDGVATPTKNRFGPMTALPVWPSKEVRSVG